MIRLRFFSRFSYANLVIFCSIGIEVVIIDPAGIPAARSAKEPNIRDIDDLDKITLMQRPVHGE
jgi:hypothetical protein